jgi:hypothetical protein
VKSSALRLESISPGVDQIVREILDAAAARNCDGLKLLLHPYLHWAEGDAVTLRGRTNVLRWLATREGPLGPPARVELRDGQVYRWTA